MGALMAAIGQRLRRSPDFECAVEVDPRSAAIHALACHFRLATESVELSYLIDFKKYFAPEMDRLRRLPVRVVCAVFDRFLREREARAQYSKVI